MKKKFDYLSIIREYELFVISGVIIAVVILFSLVFLIPSFTQTQQIIDQKSVLSDRVSRLRKKDATLSSLDSDYYKTVFPKINQVLPEDKDFGSLFSTLDTLEKTTGVSIVRTDFQLGVISTNSGRLVRAQNSQAYVVPLSIDAMGSANSLLTFIDALNSLTVRIITIKDLNWVAKSPGIFGLTINGQAYFYPSPLTLGSVDTPLPQLNEKQKSILDTINKIQTVSADEEAAPGQVVVGKRNLFE